MHSLPTRTNDKYGLDTSEQFTKADAKPRWSNNHIIYTTQHLTARSKNLPKSQTLSTAHLQNKSKSINKTVNSKENNENET